jgi:serine carboxypeptidase-like clade II
MFPSCNNSVLQYELLNLQIPTINVVGSLVRSGIRVLVYRYDEIKVQSSFFNHF